jgi:hypothetical protein
VSSAADKHNRAKSDMLGEFNKAITGAQGLRQAETGVSDDDSGAARETSEEKPGSGVPGPAGAIQAPVRTAVETADARPEFSSPVRSSIPPERQQMPIDIQQLAMQIYIQTVSPGIMDRVVQGSSLEKLFKGAATNSIAAAEEFARAFEKTGA